MNINLDETAYSEISIKIKVDPESELSIKCKELLLRRTPEWFSIRSGIKVIAEGYFEVVSEVVVASTNNTTYLYTLIHAERPKKEFEDIYRGYVIKQEHSDYFIGPDTDRKYTILREHALRFTKKEAIECIQNGLFREDGPFVIEDAK